MRAIAELERRLDEPQHLPDVRPEIVRLYRERLRRLRPSLDYWEKSHFRLGIMSLASNIDRPEDQPPNVYLRSCLFYLRKALAPPARRSRMWKRPIESDVDVLTYDQFGRSA